MEKVWLKNYDTNVPHEIDVDSYSCINEIFLECCEKYKDKPAFVNMGKYISFQELIDYTRDFAAFLQEDLKLKKGDRVAVMMPNLLQYPIAMFGALRAGCTIVNVNPLYTAKELEYQLKDSGAKAIVILENFANTLEKVVDNTYIEHVIVTKLVDMFNFPKSFLIDTVIRYVKKMIPAWNIPDHIKFKDALSRGKDLEYTPANLHHSDIAFLQYTGGTTGVAKGAMLTHRNILANIQQALSWIKDGVEFGNETIITALPLYHIFSLTANCLVFAHLGALNVLITNPKDIPNFVKELSKHKFTTFTGVNTLFNALLNNPNFSKVDFSRLKLSLGGGMAVQHAVAERWKQVTGCPLIEAYGLTETSPAACINPISSKDYNGSIGLPLPSTDVCIRDEDGKELGFNEAGELCIKGPQVMSGYWNKPEETAIALDNDGWFRTGDIATINEDGYVKIVDRKKDMIIVSGFNVYPNEVEDTIAEMEEVKEVAVIGVKNGENGEKVKAFVVKNTDVTEEQVIAHCKQNLTAYKIPKIVEFCDELPKTNVGKILRRALRETNDPNNNEMAAG